MLKIFIILAISNLITSLTLFAQFTVQDSISNSKQLIAIEQQMMDAIPTGNAATWNRYLDKNFFIVTEDGSRLSRAEFMETVKPLPKGYSGWIKVTNPKVSFAKNVAVINYISDEYEFVFGQKIHTTYSSMNTYIKTETGWKMITSQVFEIPQLPPAIHLVNEVLKKYTGTYQLTDTITCSITLQNDTLYMQKKGRAKEALLPETETVFFRNSDTRGRKYFVSNETGNMILLERRNGQDVAWKRIK
ncbi:MAG: DUF4440 domain-containing protein [Ferruginibacter sp.]